jgi:hypothetical protein
MMSELELKKISPPTPTPSPSASGPYGVAGDSPGGLPSADLFIARENVRPQVSIVQTIVPEVGIARLAFGAMLILAGGILAAIPQEFWAGLLNTAHPLFREQVARWVGAGLVIMIGLVSARVDLLQWLTTSSLLVLTAFCIDRLLGERLTSLVESAMPTGVMAWQFFFVACLLLACFVHAGRQVERVNVVATFGIVLVAMAAMGTVEGWYQWDKIAAVMGPKVSQFLGKWLKEGTWFIVLVLVAVGLACSRTRVTHFLNAILLLALAWHCVQSSYVEMRQFPELSVAAGRKIAIEESSYKNVELYEWVITGTLVILSAIYFHMAMGLGALSVIFAIAWLMAALALSQSVGTMSVVRAGYDALGGKSGLAILGNNMGLPTNAVATLPRGPQSRLPARSLSAQAEQDAARFEIVREVGIREGTPFLWILLTAVFAGIVAATGFRMLLPEPVHRHWLCMALVLAFGVCLVMLYGNWPRNPDQSWANWLAAFKLSRYHSHAVWVIFIGATALASAFAMQPGSHVAAWINLSIACIFMGTMATLLGAAILIQFGNFPQLPAWIYLVITIAQSSLAWALLMHLNYSARSPRARSLMM